jgi:hypothetical protein
VSVTTETVDDRTPVVKITPERAKARGAARRSPHEMRKPLALFGAAVLVLMTAACNPTTPAMSSCLSRTNIRVLSGSQGQLDGERQAIAANQTIDARNAVWDDPISYQVLIRDNLLGLSSNVCFAGGSVSTPYPDSDSWDLWHNRTGILSEEPSTQILGSSVSTEGDALDFESQATNWTVRGVHLRDIHDDCVQDDEMNSGLIDDSFFDGCYSGISAMGFAGNIFDGTGNTITISNSLIRLADMASVSSGTSPGHSGFFKFAGHMSTEGHSPALVINNTVFEADSNTDIGDMGIPAWQDASGVWHTYLTSCSNNTMVWLGTGPYPKTLPSCFKVTTDGSVWINAVATWQNYHPGS